MYRRGSDQPVSYDTMIVDSIPQAMKNLFKEGI